MGMLRFDTGADDRIVGIDVLEMFRLKLVGPAGRGRLPHTKGTGPDLSPGMEAMNLL